MRAIITVTKMKVMRCDYKITYVKGAKRMSREFRGDSAEAAAQAVEMASRGDSIIVASSDVMQHVPSEYGGKA